MKRPIRTVAGAAAAGAVLLAACGAAPSGAATTSAKSSTRAPIKIALLDSTTGPAGTEYQRAPQGFLARIALQNAEGGVDGHKLVPVVVNDAGNFSQETSIVQGAVETKGAFGIVSVTPFMFAGYRWLQQSGIPVTGSSSDGPEWAVPQNDNMFASDTGNITPDAKANTALSKLFELAAGKQASVAALGYSISPLSSQAAKNAVAAAKHAGLKAPYLNTSVTFGSTNFTSEALAIKQSKANVVVPTMVDSSNFALVQALRNAGAKVTPILATGLEPTIVGSPSWTALQGSLFFQSFVPAQLHTKATKAFQAALAKYEHVPTKTFPDFAVYQAWLGADAMIKGLQLDGPNPTRAGMIAKLRKLTDYNGGGLLSHPIDYATLMKEPGPTCLYALKAVKTGFQPIDTKPICGPEIPGTGTGTAT